MKSCYTMVIVVCIVVFSGSFLSLSSFAQDAPPPLPAIGIEGYGGIFSTYTAYLTNPAKGEDIFGLPSFAYTYVHLGQGRNLNTFALTETLWDRVELGFAYNLLDIGDLPQAVERATNLLIEDDSVGLYNFNARLSLLKEGDFDLPWLPALTAGVHYKHNDTIDEIDQDLLGTLTGIGIEDEDGVDFTLYATKLFTQFPRPVLVDVGVRATEAAHLGLLGFTNKYECTVEGNVMVFLTDRWLIGGEYRMKPNEYQSIPGLVEGEDDWWTLCTCYIINDHLTLSAGYGHFGSILNHEANGSWGIRVKWEF